MVDTESLLVTNRDDLILDDLESSFRNGHNGTGLALERCSVLQQLSSRMIPVRSFLAWLLSLVRFLAHRPPWRGRLQPWAGLLYSLMVHHNRLLGIDSA
ncbi:hypothetical protein ACFLT5_02550 [Chloroflexota bacterium]